VSKHENEHLNARQIATNPASSAMRLDQETERELYALYKDYCPISVEGITPAPPALAEAALASYRQDIYFPDYGAATLKRLRASRGRAWFWTRWSYEESRQLLALHEWLIAAGAASADELRTLWESTLDTGRWEPPCDDAVGLFVDALLWEFSEIERAEALKALADAENQPVLSALMERTLVDEAAHRDFLAESLRILAQRHLPLVESALQLIAASHESPTLESELKVYLGLA
jgi:hypothetical protein